jgi:hypothetical protein
MSRPLQSISIAAPAILGLNTQSSSVNLKDGFALEADNCVIDKFGRLGARAGWTQRTTQLAGGGSSAAVDLLGMHHFIDFTGTKTIISWSADQFYTGYATLTPIDVETTTNVQTLTAGNWMGATLNDLSYFFQEGYKPLVYDPTGNTGAGSLTTLEDFAGHAGTTPDAGFVMSAFGRLWTTHTANDVVTIAFSDVNDGRVWTGGSAGSLDISSVFPRGTDVITGLATQNGALVILCKNSIVIYDDQVGGFSGTITVANLTLSDIIYGVGCLSAKTIVNTGTDVLFLDSTGVRSIGRTIQEKSRPMRDVSMNVRDDLLADVSSLANPDEITAVYSPVDAFYLLALPSISKAYCFDTKGTLEDGSFRVTTWSKVPHVSYSFDPITDVINIATAGGIAEYSGYTDNGEPYDMRYYTNHFDMGDSSRTKILKKINATIIGPAGQSFVIKVASDYSTSFTPYINFLKTGTIYEYDIAEYGTAEYAGGIILENISSSVGGSGTILQMGFESTINGQILSLQKLDIFTKMGRMI